MYYRLSFDMDRLDESLKAGTNTIYAEATNMDEIEYSPRRRRFGMGRFRNREAAG